MEQFYSSLYVETIYLFFVIICNILYNILTDSLSCCAGAYFLTKAQGKINKMYIIIAIINK